MKNLNLIEIPHYDPELKEKAQLFRRKLGKSGIYTIETKRGLIESTLYSRTPLEAKELLEYGKYAIVFIISSYFAGILGQFGSDTYKKLVYKLKKFIISIKSKKDILLIVEIERTKNFPLKLCFVVNKNLSDRDILTALNSIPIATKLVSTTLEKYKNTEALLINFSNQNWNLNNVKSLEINYGTTSWWAMRVLKSRGVYEEKYFSSKFKLNQTLWEYINETPSEEANKNALRHRIEYYQRLYTVDEIKYALYVFHGATISIDIFQSFIDAPNGKIPFPKIEEKRLGSHSIALVGYNEQEFIFANSWGKEWGDAGFGYLPFDYINKFLIEAWTNVRFPIITKDNFWRLKAWKNFIKRRKEKKILEKGEFLDKRKLNIRYEIYSAKPIAPSRGYFFIINLFDNKIKNKKGGWVHFSLEPMSKKIEIEELFIEENNRNTGWGSKILNIIEKYARTWNIRSIIGWISVQDCRDEIEEKMLKYFLNKNGFDIIEDQSRFPGCLFRIEKTL
jgi:GNAT superfamily N-acetyltransferase